MKHSLFLTFKKGLILFYFTLDISFETKVDYEGPPGNERMIFIIFSNVKNINFVVVPDRAKVLG